MNEEKVNKIARSLSEIMIGAILSSVFITHSQNFKVELIILTISSLVRRITDK